MNFRILQTGDKFYSFEEFVTLPDSSLEPDRQWGVLMDGEGWLFRYKLAKEMWNKYGKYPPSNNIKVSVIVNGHGNLWVSLCTKEDLKHCPTRILIYPNGSTDSEYFFYLKRDDNNYSLVDKNLWWRSIYIPN